MAKFIAQVVAMFRKTQLSSTTPMGVLFQSALRGCGDKWLKFSECKHGRWRQMRLWTGAPPSQSGHEHVQQKQPTEHKCLGRPVSFWTNTGRHCVVLLVHQ